MFELTPGDIGPYKLGCDDFVDAEVVQVVVQ